MGEVTYKRIWQVAYPILIGGLAENINNVIDTAFIGRLGETAIGAVGMGGMYYFNFVVLVMGLSAGSQIIIGRRNGEGNFRNAGNVFTHSLLLFSLIALAMIALLHFFTSFLLHLLLESENIYGESIKYTGIRIFGLLFISVSICFRAFFIGITKTRVITIITIIGALVNIVLDYLLIFGKFGFPALGIEGAAYATLIAEAVAMSGFVLAAYVLPFIKEYKILQLKDFSFSIIWNVVKVGSPLMLQTWISFSAWLVFFLFIEKMGERELAASSIVKNIYLLYLIPMWGFASATNTLTSNLIGQGKQYEVNRLLKKIIVLTMGIMLILVQINFLFPRSIISVFSKDVALIESALGPLWIVSIALVFYSVSVVLFNGVSGSGDTRTALLIEIVTIALYFIYIFLVTSFFQMTMMVIWTSEIVYMLVLGILSYLRLRSGKWKKAKV